MRYDLVKCGGEIGRFQQTDFRKCVCIKNIFPKTDRFTLSLDFPPSSARFRHLVALIYSNVK